MTKAQATAFVDEHLKRYGAVTGRDMEGWKKKAKQRVDIMLAKGELVRITDVSDMQPFAVYRRP